MNSKRGVSVIIGALLLVALAVAAAVLLYTYSIGLLGGLETSGGQQMKSQLIMESYNWQSAALTLTLRNVGVTAIDLRTTDFILNGYMATVTVQSNCLTLAPSTSCIVTLTIPFAATTGTSYLVKVVTSAGSVFAYSVVAGETG